MSSLDSEEQESLRTNERLHNRTNRNSTGGISTHSLNEAELAVRYSITVDYKIFNSNFNFREILKKLLNGILFQRNVVCH